MTSPSKQYHSNIEILGNYPTFNKPIIAVKKSKHTESQIVFALQQAQTGTPVSDTSCLSTFWLFSFRFIIYELNIHLRAAYAEGRYEV